MQVTSLTSCPEHNLMFSCHQTNNDYIRNINMINGICHKTIFTYNVTRHCSTQHNKTSLTITLASTYFIMWTSLTSFAISLATTSQCSIWSSYMLLTTHVNLVGGAAKLYFSVILSLIYNLQNLAPLLLWHQIWL